MSVRNHPQMVRRAPIRAFERDGSLMAQAPFERKALISRLKASDSLKAKTNFSSLDTPKGLTVRLLIRRSAPGPRRSRNEIGRASCRERGTSYADEGVCKQRGRLE